MDINDNIAVDINNSAALCVRQFTSDTIPPVILSYSLDLNDGMLRIAYI